MIRTAGFFAMVLILFACNGPSKVDEANVSYVVVQLPSGWGYNIYNGGRLFIRQETIQAIPGSIPFRSERDAAAVAEEVIKKLNMGESPRITVQELQRLGVSY